MTVAVAVVALGSNLGDRLGYLRSAVDRIGELGTVRAVSALYETDPVGGPEQGRYLNAVVLLHTSMSPADLLAALLLVEGDADRERRVRWGPRTLDLDLIAYDHERIAQPGLEVPHPRAHERRFVLAPLAEVAPDVVLADGRTVVEALPSVAGQRIVRWKGDWVGQDPGLGGEAGAWVTGQFLLLALWALATFGRPGSPGPLFRAGGALLVGAGVAMGTAAAARFGWPITPSPQPRAGSPLVRSGVYRLVLHPMYGAVILGTGGLAAWLGSVAGLAVSAPLAVFFRLKVIREERILSIVHPEYPEHVRQVRQRFLPWLW